MQVSEFWEEQRIKVQNMMENKRSPCSFDQGTFICLPNKRHKADPSISSKEEQRIKVQNMMENTRSPCSFDQGTFTCLPTKGHKADPSISPKENKVKLGERITALQQLVSPYGKTDTASVLLEAMEYIQFLHEQVKVLSTPYLQCTSADQMQELEQYSLGCRGLCLVPLSCTAGVARSNGADIWAPIKATSKFENTS